MNQFRQEQDKNNIIYENRKKKSNKNTEANGLTFMGKRCKQNIYNICILLSFKLVNPTENLFRQERCSCGFLKTMKIVNNNNCNCMK